MSTKNIDELNVYRHNHLVGKLKRTKTGCELHYDQSFLQKDQFHEVSYRMKKRPQPHITQGVNLPPFFAGLLPEGLRLKALVKKIKTSEDDLFSLLAAIGSQCVGDVYVRREDSQPLPALPQDIQSVDFYQLFENNIHSNSASPMDSESFAGVQEKVSASMISFPLRIAKKNKSYILKLNPADKPRLVENELLSLQIAKKCGLVVNSAQLVQDKNKNTGLLVERFDRQTSKTNPEEKTMIHQEDACQFLDRYPADKYRISFNDICQALQELTTSPKIELLKLIQMYVFSYLLGNGDMHAKNISLVTHPTTGRVQLSPGYDLICTYIYKDRKMALRLNGKDDNITKKDLLHIGEQFDIPQKAIQSMLDKLTVQFEKNYHILNPALSNKETSLYHQMVKKRLTDVQSQ